MINIKELKTNKDNPRLVKNDKFTKLCNSIHDFPKMMELRPIIVDENNIILGGNMRYRALEYLGYSEIPDEWVKRADELSEEEKKEFIIKDNVSIGEWDLDELVKWDTQLLEDWGVDFEIDKDDEEQEISKYNNSNCLYPLIPLYDEKYESYVIICESVTEAIAIQTKFNFPSKAQSYKASFLGKTNVIVAKELLKL